MESNRQSTILFVVNELAWFRAHRASLARALAGRNMRVVVLSGECTAADASENEPWQLLPLSVDRHRFNLRLDMKMAGKIVETVRREKPDIVHLLTIKPVLFGAMAMAMFVPAEQRKTIRNVWTFPGLGRIFAPAANAGRRLLVERGLRFAARRLNPVVTTENEPDRDVLLNCKVVTDPGRIVVMDGTGIDLDHYTSAGRDTAKREKLAFGLTARLLRSKGIEAFLEAARELSGVANFVLAGLPDPDNPDAVPMSLIEDAASAGLLDYRGRVSQDDMPDLLRSIDVFCLPTRYQEGFPRSLMEAAACGCALIATDQPSTRRILKDGETGWMLDGESDIAGSLMQACKAAIADPQDSRDRGIAASTLIRSLPVDNASIQRAFFQAYGLSEDVSCD